MGGEPVACYHPLPHFSLALRQTANINRILCLLKPSDGDWGGFGPLVILFAITVLMVSSPDGDWGGFGPEKYILPNG